MCCLAPTGDLPNWQNEMSTSFGDAAILNSYLWLAESKWVNCFSARIARARTRTHPDDVERVSKSKGRSSASSPRSSGLNSRSRSQVRGSW